MVVRQLLVRGEPVKAVVRSPDRVSQELRDQPGLEIIQSDLSTATESDWNSWVSDCDAAISCLGHNMSFKGIWGKPRRLVTDAVIQLSQAVERIQNVSPFKLILMNTVGNRNRDLDEKVSLAEKCVVGLIRTLVPPHADNEDAADFLRVKVGQSHSSIQWVAVRPDSLTTAEDVSEYTLHPSPTRSAIFNSGKTSRINVAHFMVELITDEDLWNQWVGKMPVIYNKQ